MTRVLITGGTGILGSELVPRFAGADYTVRIMSRRGHPPDVDPGIEWAQAQLASGEGLSHAVSGVDLIVHAASSPFRRSEEVDVGGTERLLGQARDAGVSHFLYISIVGIDRIPLGYYKRKLAAESCVEREGVPWSILRATQFHTLIDMQLRALLRFPIGVAPTDFRFQPVDPGEVADRVLEYAEAGPSGRLPDLGGPEVSTLGDLARTWAQIRGLRRLIVPLPLPGKIAAGFRQGLNTTPEGKYGHVTWADWVRRRYGSGDAEEQVSKEVSSS